MVVASFSGSAIVWIGGQHYRSCHDCEEEGIVRAKLPQMILTSRKYELVGWVCSCRVSTVNRATAGFPLTGSELTVRVDSAANTFEVFNASGTSLAGPSAFTPPQINTGFGFSIEIDDTSAAGVTDSFTFDLSFAEGDNSNAVAMAEMADAKLMNGGTTTLVGIFENTKLDIGSKTKAAEVRAGSADAIFQQAYNRVQSESGVNLDEEAAYLMRFQQAYQASARIMTTAQTIFDTLLSSVR